MAEMGKLSLGEAQHLPKVTRLGSDSQDLDSVCLTSGLFIICLRAPVKDSGRECQQPLLPHPHPGLLSPPPAIQPPNLSRRFSGVLCFPWSFTSFCSLGSLRVPCFPQAGVHTDTATHLPTRCHIHTLRHVQVQGPTAHALKLPHTHLQRKHDNTYTRTCTSVHTFPCMKSQRPIIIYLWCSELNPGVLYQRATSPVLFILRQAFTRLLRASLSC